MTVLVNDETRPWLRPRTLAGLALVFAAAAVTLAWIVSATSGLYGYDGWFHIRYAEILRSEGVSRSFPWWDETFLRDRYADKDFLYHVLLIPFTFGDLVDGGKLAAILIGAALAGTYYLSAHRLRVPWPTAWSIGLLACSTAFLYRLGFTRPATAAVAVAVAGTAAILTRQHRWAFAFAALYPHVHISYHLLPCVALLHGFHLLRQEEKEAGEEPPFRLAAWTAAGAVTGAVITPYFPNNIYLWWVQNVRVLGLAWRAPEDLGMGLEIRAGLSSQLLGYNAAAFLAMGMAIYLLARARKSASREALTLLVVSCGFLGLSMMSRRFIEFWIPFTMLLAGVAVRDALAARATGARSPSRGFVGVTAVVLLAPLLFWNAREARGIVRRDPGAIFEGASLWMRSNVPPGEKIFHFDWDQFPQLFFFNPQFRYLMGLDPAFMYVTNPERWRKWQQVTHGEAADPYGAIRHDFGSRWVIGVPAAEDFMRGARRDPRFFPRYEDANAVVFFLADGFEFLESWEVTGWYPDPSRSLFDATLGPEPAGAGRPAGPVAQGAGRLEEPGTQGAGVPEPRSAVGRGFTDLRRLLRVPASHQEVCAVARTRVTGTVSGPVTLGLTTDDEYRLYLDGVEIASHSPLLDPPPGTPGGPPVSLDELVDVPRRVEESLVVVSLQEGANEIIVKLCQVGDDLGFYLRAFREDGSHLASSLHSSADGAVRGRSSR